VTLKPYWHLKTLWRLVWLTLPLGIVMMMASLNLNIPRYFIEQYLGEKELGFYAAVAYLMLVTGMIINSLGQSATPRLAKFYAAGDRAAFQTLILKLLGIGVVTGAGGVVAAVLAGRGILTLVYKPEYAEHTDLFVWIMCATAIADLSSFLGYGMTAARYFRIQLPLLTLVTATSTLACFWLIPTHGLIGAAIALIIAAIVQLVLSSGVVLHALHHIRSSKV
jgi:O-antigen/teichoic acid export membrane protein